MSERETVKERVIGRDIEEQNEREREREDNMTAIDSK